jgi:hypothetical protein
MTKIIRNRVQPNAHAVGDASSSDSDTPDSQQQTRPVAFHLPQGVVAHAGPAATLGACLAPDHPLIGFFSLSDLATLARTSSVNRRAIAAIIRSDPRLGPVFRQLGQANSDLAIDELINSGNPGCYALTAFGASGVSAASFTLIAGEAGIILGAASLSVAIVAAAILVVESCLKEPSEQREQILTNLRDIEEGATHDERYGQQSADVEAMNNRQRQLRNAAMQRTNAGHEA